MLTRTGFWKWLVVNVNVMIVNHRGQRVDSGVSLNATETQSVDERSGSLAQVLVETKLGRAELIFHSDDPPHQTRQEALQVP